jgi:putative membrane protein
MRASKIIFAIVIVLLIIVLIIQNTEAVETRILFATISLPRAVLLIITLAIGWIAGMVTAEALTVRAGSSDADD